MLARSASMGNRIAIYNGNALKIGLFGANCSSGRSAIKVPERWADKLAGLRYSLVRGHKRQSAPQPAHTSRNPRRAVSLLSSKQQTGDATKYRKNKK